MSKYKKEKKERVSLLPFYMSVNSLACSLAKINMLNEIMIESINTERMSHCQGHLFFPFSAECDICGHASAAFIKL